jgi:hypothetical protein
MIYNTFRAVKNNLFISSKMNRFICILLLLTKISFAQTNEKFLSDFLLGDELDNQNVIAFYNRFDFSEIWNQTENYRIVGIIGAEHQRIKIKLISVKRNSIIPNEYFVSGKTSVKGIICDFSGRIKLTEIKEAKKLHYGVDDEYKDKGIKSQGILIADYEFIENPKQHHSGIFKGQLYSKWYLNSDNQIKYDNTGSNADGYMNNAFVGIWKGNSVEKEKICNWADFRVPKANQDFDIGAGDFSPSEKYYEKGWADYQKAWFNGDKEAQNEELKEWWK